MEFVYVIYYNSQSACDDDIMSAHSTLEGAVEEAQRLTKEMYYDIYEEEMNLEVRKGTSSTKGVNMGGWSVQSYNIYKIPFKK